MCGINVLLCLVSAVLFLWVLLSTLELAPCTMSCAAQVWCRLTCKRVVASTGSMVYRCLSVGSRRWPCRAGLSEQFSCAVPAGRRLAKQQTTGSSSWEIPLASGLTGFANHIEPGEECCCSSGVAWHGLVTPLGSSGVHWRKATQRCHSSKHRGGGVLFWV